MRKTQRLSIRMSELRTNLNAAVEKRNKSKAADDSDEVRGIVKEIDTSARQLSDVEIEYRAALLQEAEEDEKAGKSADPDAEERERRKLVSQARATDIIFEAVEERAATGATAEARSALLGDRARERMLPFEFLLPREEERTNVTPVTDAAASAGTQASVIERVFTRSVAGRLLVSMPAVAIGESSFPVMTAGTTALQRSPDSAVVAQAGAFTGFSLDPIRLSARYLFRVEDTYRLRNFESILRRDLAAVMSDKMDDQVINGDGVAPNVNGYLSELAAPANPGATSTHAAWLALFTGLVDGLNAYTLSDIRAVIGTESYVNGESVYRGNQSNDTVIQTLQQRSGGITVSSRIPVAGNDKRQTNIAALTSYPGRNAVAPIWKAMEVIRDPYTGAASGQIALTAVMLWNFKILRETGFSLFDIQKA